MPRPDGRRRSGSSAGVIVHINGLEKWPELQVSPRAVDEAARAALNTCTGMLAGELSLSLLDDAEMAKLNAEWLSRDGPTDVIAFSLGTADALLGDVYIGAETARRNAESLGIEPFEELLRLAIHGTLHVLGHDHPEGEARYGCDMYLLQEELLRSLRDS